MGKKKTTAPVQELEVKSAASPAAEAANVVSPAAASPAEAVNVVPPAAQSAPEPPAAAEGVAVEDLFPGDVDTGELAAVSSANGLNLREGPGVGFPVVEVLPEAAVLAVQPLPCGTEVPGWALVHTGVRAGWVDVRYIQALTPAEG